MCEYRELLLWQQARQLAHHVFRATHGLHTADHFDLATRLRDAAMAIPRQIALHYSPDGARFLQGLQRARRALLKLEHLVDLASGLQYWPALCTPSLLRHIGHVRRHLEAFVHSLAPPARM